MGVPLIRTVVFWGLYWGTSILGNYHRKHSEIYGGDVAALSGFRLDHIAIFSSLLQRFMNSADYGTFGRELGSSKLGLFEQIFVMNTEI